MLAIMLMLLFLMFVLLFISLTAQSVQAQTYTVIHNFTGGQDGANPYAGLTIDRAGNLYGTASGGGLGFGTVFKLSKSRAGGWILTPLYLFLGGDGTYTPTTGVIFGPDGSLYGTTPQGGQNGGGTAYNLRPAAHALPNVGGDWTDTSCPNGSKEKF